ncbi:thiamine biosynthesis protein ThiS [Methanofollis aquaemaris]|uniref:Thiamine biosynthesis protein ThiS n=1 Tax=Methanofollis aquaemaris TaxID=126734 RepID=A0A8A3S1V2_9EURY|nr:MoaD/ThiS family protein [Methanofollis aquaemaris]QSZ66182.1 thiamine biosynthesis protein ThiS [Methanofollis aquaemaris]
MKVHLPDGRTREITVERLTVEEVLVALGINPLEVFVSRDGRLVPEDTVVGDDDELTVVRFVHGG